MKEQYFKPQLGTLDDCSNDHLNALREGVLMELAQKNDEALTEVRDALDELLEWRYGVRFLATRQPPRREWLN